MLAALGRYGMAAALVAVALGLRLALDPVLQTNSPYLPFTLAVMVAGRYGGLGPGLVATGCSALGAWYFLLEPRYSLAIPAPAATASLVLFCVVGVGISLLTGQLHRALAATRNSEKQLRRFVEFAPAAIAMFDRNMRYLAASQRYRQDYGLTGRLEGRSHYEVFPEIPERWKEMHRRVLSGAAERSEEDAFERADGRVEWLRWEMRPWLQADGGIGGAVLATEDITSRKHAEEALRQSEERFRTLFEQAGDAILIVNPDARFSEVNARGLELTGYTREEFLSLSVTDFVAPQDRERAAEAVRRVAAGHASLAERQFVRKDGSTFPGEVSARLLPDGRIIAIVRDLSERRRLELQFVQAQKLEGIGRLASGVAHDFNNLLTIIGGYSQMLLSEPVVEHRIHEPVKEIAKASERAAGLTRQLLGFSRHRIIEPRTIAIDDVVRNFEKMLRRIIGEDVDLCLALDAQSLGFRADPGQIEQVILNLAVNARDAMPTGGTLLIETGTFTVDDEFAAEHRSVSTGPHLTLAISDTGVGMSPETKAHLFEPFFTTKEPGRGTGLGLSMVSDIVRQSGGSIQVYSEPGRGSTFRMLFPAIEGTVEPAPQATVAAPGSGTGTILLVEDEAAVRRYVRQVLERRGYTVIEASNGRDALDWTGRNENTVDLLLTDVIMPEMGGLELAARLGGGQSPVPVLCMSGYTDRLWRPDPSINFLQKPFTAEALLRLVRELISRRRAAGAD